MAGATEERVDEIESRLETLELMVDERFRSKVEEGLKDMEEGDVVRLEDYEEERDLK